VCSSDLALRDGSAGMIERLADDHANARRLAEGLAELPGIEGRQPGTPFDPRDVRTNIVIFALRPGARESFLAALEAEGVAMIPFYGETIRAVTHYGIEAADIDRTLEAARRAVGAPIAVPVG